MPWSQERVQSPNGRWSVQLWVQSTGGRGAGLYIIGAWVLFETLSGQEIGRVAYQYMGDDDVLEVSCHDEKDGAISFVQGGEITTFPAPASTPFEHASAAPDPLRCPGLLFSAPVGSSLALIASVVAALRGRRGLGPAGARMVHGGHIWVSQEGVSEQDLLAILAIDTSPDVADGAHAAREPEPWRVIDGVASMTRITANPLGVRVTRVE